MSAEFDRDRAAEEHAKRHREIDPFVTAVHYLPTDAPDREIRLVEVNKAMLPMGRPEPIDFGVAAGSPDKHTLIVMDVTPAQWDAIRSGTLPLPDGWTLDGGREVGRGKRPRGRR